MLRSISFVGPSHSVDTSNIASHGQQSNWKTASTKGESKPVLQISEMLNCLVVGKIARVVISIEVAMSQSAKETSIDRELELRWLYEQVISAWDKRDAKEFAQFFADDATVIGFDGSLHDGRAALRADLANIFESHPTPPYVSKVKQIKIMDNVGILVAIVGMVLPGTDELEPKLNARQVMVALRTDGKWLINVFQNTPAAFHGRPELLDEMTGELNEIWQELKALEPKVEKK